VAVHTLPAACANDRGPWRRSVERAPYRSDVFLGNMRVAGGGTD
jgi:hypothetical protein